MVKMTKRELETEIFRLKNSVKFFKEMWIKERAKEIKRRYSTPAGGPFNPTTETHLPSPTGNWRCLTKKEAIKVAAEQIEFEINMG
jgi:hypothetical protein